MDEEIRKTVDHLIQGHVILYPTDTIWGIGCDATNPSAVQRIFDIKQRPGHKSMLVLMSDPEMLSRYLEKVPGKALEIISSASKPTTIIYPGAHGLAPSLMAEDGSVGIRIPSDPFCRKLIETFGIPVVSTSANTSANPSPDSFGEIETTILERVDYVVNWRQDDMTPSSPSSLVRVDQKGRATVVRP